MAKKHPRTKALSTLLTTLAFLAGLWGCGGTREAGDRPQRDDHGPRKVLWVLPLTDQAQLDPDVGPRLRQGLLDRLKRSSRLVVEKSPPDLQVPRNPRSGLFGIVTDPGWVEEARTRGANALLDWILPPPEVRQTRKGVWPFRTPRVIYTFSLAFNLVDVTTGTVLLSRTESSRAILEPEILEGLSAEGAFRKASDIALPRILDETAKGLSSALEDLPWTARILEAGPERVVLGCPREAGVREGDRFEVFSWSGKARAFADRTFPVPGEKKGEVSVVEVGGDRCFARVVEGGPFEAGQTVRHRP